MKALLRYSRTLFAREGLLDHLIGLREERGWNVDAEGLERFSELAASLERRVGSSMGISLAGAPRRNEQ